MRRDPSPELLAAYVDGVAELTPDERRRVEDHLAADPSARADADAARELLGRLRDLPPEGGAPDWAALERSISDAVGPTVPRSWWRRFGWRLAAPGVALAAAAAIIGVIARPAEPTVAPPIAGTQHAPEARPSELPDEATIQLWLDGKTPELADKATIQLYLDGKTVEVDLDAEQLLEVPWGGDLNEEDLLPAADLAWVVELDSAALDRAERWLADPQLDPPRSSRGNERS